MKNTSFILSELVKRDFKVKYKRSVLGVFWSFLNPLFMALVQYLVFSNLFRADIKFYATYLLCGVTFFNYFSDVLNQSVFVIVGNASLMKKVKISSEIFSIAKVLSCGINFGLSLIPVFLFALFSGIKINFSIFFMPINICLFMIFLLGMSMILSSLMVFFRDIQFLWSVICMIWMYGTPIFYSELILPNWLIKIESLNPLYQAISNFRCILIDGKFPSPQIIFIQLITSFVVLIIGFIIFKSLKRKFVLFL